MADWLRRLFNRDSKPPKDQNFKAATPEPDEEEYRRWYDHKSALMEKSLGKEHNLVMHAIVCYANGGNLDLYYYPSGIPGTAIATKELSESPGKGPSNRVYRSYELVMFTKQPINLDHAYVTSTSFGEMHDSINMILNAIARYSAEAELNPRDTCEFPSDMEHIGGKCLIFDGYACHSDELADHFGLLAIIEIFRSELNFARQHGSAELIKRLKDAGHYPYSDLDREPVA